jgi:hypothetical protein
MHDLLGRRLTCSKGDASECTAARVEGKQDGRGGPGERPDCAFRDKVVELRIQNCDYEHEVKHSCEREGWHRALCMG